jgi:hypothetical protein
VPTVDIDRDAAHEAAQSELNKPIYPGASLTDRINEWIEDLIYRIVAKGELIPGGWFTIMVLLIILAIGILVAVRIARKTLRTNRGADHQLFGSTELSAAAHRDLAQQSAARGDFAAAIRHRLRALARHLEEVGTLLPVPGRTANELSRDAGAALPELSAELNSAATTFNEVTYGELPGTPAAYQMISDLDDHLRTRSSASAPAQPATTRTGWADVQ